MYENVNKKNDCVVIEGKMYIYMYLTDMANLLKLYF